MRLTDLDPHWYEYGRRGNRVGMTFRCPHCPNESGTRLAIALHLDGTNMDPDPENPQQFTSGETIWTITSGHSWENMSLAPSIDASAAGHWHGFITNGEIVGGILMPADLEWWAWSDKVKPPPKSEGAARWQARQKKETRRAAQRLLPIIRKAAKAMGYAIGLHGSVSRDIDLIAVPWGDESYEPEELAQVICWICQAETGWGFFSSADANPTVKPHGRLAWSIHMWGTYIDLSVTPRNP